MPSKIENEILIPNDILALTEFQISIDQIRLTFAPWTDLLSGRKLRFRKAKLIWISEVFGPSELDQDEVQLPWDPIGFDSDNIEDGRWRFCLNTPVLEMAFEAEWPELT